MLLFSVSVSNATIYFIDSELGDDKSSGKEVSSSWQSIQRINAHEFQAGDSILFRRGRVWSDVLIKVSSVDLTLGAYGEGDKPKLLGSIQRNDWHSVPSIAGVYAMYVPRPVNQKDWTNWEVQLVMEEGFLFYKREKKEINPNALVPGTFTYNKIEQRLYIKPINNTIQGKNFYIGQQENIIQIEHAEFERLVISDLEISLANRYGIGPWWQGDEMVQGDIVIKNNLFIGNAFSAVCLSGGMQYDNILIDNNIIRENGAEGIYIGKHAAKVSLTITNNQLGSEQQDSFGWRGEGPTSAFNGDGIDIKYGNRKVRVASNLIKNLHGTCGICYGSGDSIIENNVIKNIGMQGDRWPAGIMADINDDYGTSTIKSNIIKGDNMYGINVRGKATIGPPLVIEQNWIELPKDSEYAQIGFTAMNAANVIIKSNNGTGGKHAMRMLGMSPNNIKVFDNNFGSIQTPFYLSSSKLTGLTVLRNYFCIGSTSFIEWINGEKELNLVRSNQYLGASDSMNEKNCNDNLFDNP